MSISALLTQSQTRLGATDERVSEFGSLVSSIDIIKDPNFQSPNAAKSKSRPTEEEEKDDLSRLTISQLNEKTNEITSNLGELNRLWIIKGLIQEIEISLDNSINEGQYDKDDLEGILTNLKSLSTKLQQIDDHWLIREQLKEQLVSFNQRLNDELLKLVSKFIIEDIESITFNQELKVREEYISFIEFERIAEDFTEYSNKPELKQVLNGLKFSWDKKILSQLIKKEKYINIDIKESVFELSITDAFPGDQFFNEYYFRSIKNFITFINAFGNQNFKNYFANEISNNLSNTISENITKLHENNSKDNIEELKNIVELSNRTNWALSFTKSFSSSEKINEQLNYLYLDWVVDKYINELRKIFSSNEFDKLLQTLSVAKNDDDDWNNSWGSEEEEEEEEDAWDNEWDEDWGEEPKAKSKTPKNDNQLKISRVPEKVGEIIGKFHQETGPNTDDELLISCIISFSLLGYPSMGESFLLYNDLNHLGQILQKNRLSISAESNWSQQTIVYSNELFKILLSQHITEDNDDEFKEPIDLKNWFETLQKSQLSFTNFDKFKNSIIQFIEVINNWLINAIINLNEITESQSDKISKFIIYIQKITLDNLSLVNEPLTSIKSSNKLQQTYILINNHLKDIMEFFYQGELFDYKTDELIKVIESVFIKSDLRDNYIREIVEIRSIDE